MTPEVQVGCNFTQAAPSGGPPAISGTSVGPSIAAQPLSATVTGGQTCHAYESQARDHQLFSYQWQRNAANIPGATSTSYTTPATTLLTTEQCSTVEVSESQS